MRRRAEEKMDVDSALDGVRRPYLITTDYTAFESHFKRPVFDACEFQLYEYMTSRLPEGRLFMERVRRVIGGVNQIAFKYVNATVPCGRMSGEMNTSLGNGFTNLMVFLFLNSELGNENVDCLIEGDDCLGSFYGLPLTGEMYERLGFTVKIVYPPKANVASFCGQIFDFETLTVITDPHKVIMNLAWVHPLYCGMSERTSRALLRSKAMSVLAQYPGCPILQEMAVAYIRLTQGVTPKLDSSLSIFEREQQLAFMKGFIMEDRVRPVAMATRELVEELFGFSVQSQMLIEQYFRDTSAICPITHPFVYDRVTQVQYEYDARYVRPDLGDYFM